MPRAAAARPSPPVSGRLPHTQPHAARKGCRALAEWDGSGVHALAFQVETPEDHKTGAFLSHLASRARVLSL